MLTEWVVVCMQTRKNLWYSYSFIDIAHYTNHSVHPGQPVRMPNRVMARRWWVWLRAILFCELFHHLAYIIAYLAVSHR